MRGKLWVASIAVAVAMPACAATSVIMPLSSGAVGLDFQSSESAPLKDAQTIDAGAVIAEIEREREVAANSPRALPIVIAALADETPFELPEPGTWAMVIAGFGLAGVAIRSRSSGHGRQFS